jgi:hypothetical protein
MSTKDEPKVPGNAASEQPTIAGAVELQEDELDQAVGGRKAGEGQKDFLKVTLKEVFITG